MENNNDLELADLAYVIDIFYTNKQNLDDLKKITDEQNSKIKEILMNNNLDKFETGKGLVAKLIIQNRESFKEKELIEKLFELGYNEIIDLVPTINYDKLEDAIYNGRLDATILSDYKVINKIPVLKVTKKK